MRSQKNVCFGWFRCAVLVVAIGFCSLSAWGSSDLLHGAQPGSDRESSSTESIPDAPSALRSASYARVSGEVQVPLEQQAHPEVTVKRAPIDVARNGVNIFVSPAYLRKSDLKWVLPLAGATAAAFATDTKTMTEVVSSNPSFNQTNINVSNGLVGGMIAAPVVLFGVGQFSHRERPRETGILSGEAMVDALVVDEVVKLCTFRERPLVDQGQGEFYIGKAGVDSSFVSAHSMIAWSSAAVIAGEYPSKWVKLGVYSGAVGVSLTRVMGQEHFPSDVLLGAAGGWLIGHYVLRAHHHVPLEYAAR